MKYFFKNYLPYGCMGAVIATVVNCIYAIVRNGNETPIEVLILIGITMVLTVVSYLLSQVDFKSERMLYLCEYLSYMAIIVVSCLIVANPDAMPRMLIEWLAWATSIYVFIRCYVNKVFMDDVKKMNEDLKQLHKN
ncbi:DUF3021 family protein [Breznakia pachnodae]|uniref:DUF3021 family protein n=1 Tax=Breznakia pachnodae TaxID=265178 RepID=A0ABU0E2U1_9FIRM|nr:DUF3021 family protein [Breznakia pachnodae]MDQ0361194.1 hypothetical protein [Breznakia pachnodae]